MYMCTMCTTVLFRGDIPLILLLACIAYAPVFQTSFTASAVVHFIKKSISFKRPPHTAPQLKDTSPYTYSTTTREQQYHSAPPPVTAEAVVVIES